LRARDALEVIYPAAAHVGGDDSLPDGTSQDLVEAEHEVGERFRP